MGKRIVFGYGSLLNQKSLRRTIPDAENIVPCFIKGFKRDFSVWDPIGFRSGEHANVGFCALDVKKDSNPNSRVNGILFEMSENHFDSLLDREQGYRPVQVNAYDYATGKLLQEAILFSADRNNGTYSFESSAQENYLKICLDGAKSYGDDFYSEFLKSTYIDNKSLIEISPIQKLDLSNQSRSL